MNRILHLAFAMLIVLTNSAIAEIEPTQDADPPSTAVTQWTDSMELFMEHPVLAADVPGRFIIHLTILDGFQPVRDGTVTMKFQGPDGAPQEFVATELLREGIFTPTVRLPRSGTYKFELSYAGHGATSTFNIPDFIVYKTAGDIPKEPEEESRNEVAFLKEQQWKIPFATTPAVVREVKKAAWAIGEVLPSPAAYIEIVAPVDGAIQAANPGDLALPGSHVARGDVDRKSVV